MNELTKAIQGSAKPRTEADWRWLYTKGVLTVDELRDALADLDARGELKRPPLPTSTLARSTFAWCGLCEERIDDDDPARRVIYAGRRVHAVCHRDEVDRVTREVSK